MIPKEIKSSLRNVDKPDFYLDDIFNVFIVGLTSGLCGLARNDNTFYNSTNEDVTIYFHSSDIYRSTGNTGFTLVFTEFHKGIH